MKRLHLSNTDKKIFAVSAGVGEIYDIDPTVIRLILACLFLLTATIPLLLTYLAAWGILPDKPIE